MPLRYARLLRLSGKKQVERASKKGELDIPTQRQEIEVFAATREDWIFAKEYIEAGVSGYRKTRSERDQLQDAIHDAELGLYDVLVVWKGDRLSRRIQDFPGIVADLEESGIQVWSVVDAPGGKRWSSKTALDLLLLSVEGFKNQSESESTSIRSKTIRRQKAAEGKWMGGRAPFGYRLITEKDSVTGEPIFSGGRPVFMMVPNESQAAAVRTMYTKYAEGIGINLIAEWLNESGIATALGNQWTVGTVADVLDNPVYKGVLAYGRHMDKKQEGAVLIEAEGRHLPIVPDELWETVAAVRVVKGTLSKRQRSDRFGHALSGVLYCGECGSAMYGQQTSYPVKDGRVVRRGYVCSKYSQKRQCVHVRLKDVEAEDAFISALERLTEPGAVQSIVDELVREQSRAVEDAEKVGRSIKAEIVVCDEAILEARRGWLESKVLTAAEFSAVREEYLLTKGLLEERLAGLAAPEPTAVKVEAISALAHVRDNWAYMTIAERKVFALQICDALRLRPLVFKDRRLVIVPAPPKQPGVTYHWIPGGHSLQRMTSRT